MLFPSLPSSHEKTNVLDRIPIVECGEPLIVVQEVCPGVEVGKEPVFLRQSAAERLGRTQQWLEAHHPGYRLRLGDGYRTPQHQAHLFRRALLAARLLHPFWKQERVRSLAHRYVADPDAFPPPPHTTGGAVDVGLLKPWKRAGLSTMSRNGGTGRMATASGQSRQNRQPQSMDKSNILPDAECDHLQFHNVR